MSAPVRPPRRRADDAATQLRRILLVVPRLVPFEPRRAGDLARETGMPVDQLLADLRQLRDHADDVGGRTAPISVVIEGDGDEARITLMSTHFLRPMRLTVTELRALEFGLALLSAERPADERPAIAAARRRLRSILASRPDDDAETPLDGVVARIDDAARAVLAVLRAARRSRRAVTIAYRAAEATAPVARVVHPYALVTAQGYWYCLAWCTKAAALRNFRLDRIEDVTRAEGTYTIPDDFSPTAALTDGMPFVAGQPVPRCRIRYAPRIARWIAEREGRPLDADGALVLDWPLADVDWAVRHVLQYAGDAEVLAPAALRAAVATRIDAMLGQG
ncbi:MAG: WYL domain-containing protein [Gemmatimonadaceae bacterium]|jgi:proteasome accessory factor C|nr:WYL domain-containing protein [Gemmatimonadaceae bacterium]